MRVSVSGTGYVGLIQGVGLAKLGHKVICIDIDEEKVAMINRREPPICEKGLKELMKKVIPKNMTATTDLKHAVLNSQVTFVCVGTPSRRHGAIKLEQVKQVSEDIGIILREKKEPHLIVIKSTVVPGTCKDIVVPTIEQASGKKFGKDFGVAMNPEFLREGSALDDFFNPDRIVIGSADKRSINTLKQLYKNFKCPILETNFSEAEMIKYASNALLATKISFINEIGNICKKMDIDTNVVAKGVGLDFRISPHFLVSGIGFGGSCLSGKEFVLLGNPKPKLLNFKTAYENNKTKNNIMALGFDKETKLMNVKTLSKRRYKGQMIKIKTKMGRTIEATADHPMVTVNNGAFEIKLAKQLKRNDKLPLITSLPYKPVEKIDLIEELNDFDTKIKVRPKNKKTSSYKNKITKLLKHEPWRKCDFFRKNYLYLNDYKKLEKHLPKREEMLLFTTKGTPTYVPAVINLDKDFWRLIGYYLAEGNISYEKCERGTRARIQFHFNRKEKEYIEDVCDILKKLNIKYALQHRTNKTTTVVVSSRILAFLLDNILNCGVDSYTAKIPQILLFQSKEKRKELLCGLFRGDGNAYLHKNSKAVTIEFGTASEILAQGVLLLLQSLGIVASYKTQMMKKSKVPAHIIRVSCHDQVKELMFFDKKTNKKINQRLNNYKKHISPIGFKKYEEYATVSIKDIKNSFSEQDVFSLEFEKNPHLFVTSHGLVVHNCFPKDVNAIVSRATKLGYHPRLLRAVLDVNKDQPMRLLDLIEDHGPMKGKKIALLGLTFKAGTDDIRESPSLSIIKELAMEQADLYIYDPLAVPYVMSIFPHLNYTKTAQEAVDKADMVLILTEWPSFRNLDYKDKLVIDGKNLFPDKEKRPKNYEGICW